MEAVSITQISANEFEMLIERTISRILNYQKPNLQPESDQLMTVQQASEFLCLSVPTVYAYVHRSEIPFMKKAKRLYFQKSDLMKWLQESKRMSLSDIDRSTDDYLNKIKKGGSHE
jgi:excisionase family DNA binding protein